MAVVVPFIGAAIGGAIGGSFLGVAAASWGWIVGSLLASAMFKPPGQQGPRLEDLTIVGTDYGQAFPWIAGSPRIAPQYIWASAIREIPNTQKAGKGGGQKVTTYTYEVDVMLRFTENLTIGVARDWLNGELIRNDLVVKDGVWAGVSIYVGSDDQLPDPTYEAAVGAGNAPAYRGGTTMVIRSLQLGSGKQLPNFESQVCTVGQAIDDDDYLDYSGNNVPVRIEGGGWGGTSTAEAKFGASGVFLGGTEIVPNAALEFYEDTGFHRNMPAEWSIRCWLYDEGDGTYDNFVLAFGNDDGNPAGLWVYRTATDEGEVLRARYRGNPFSIDSPSTPPKNEWYYFELSKIGNTVYMFINGVGVGSVAHAFDMPCFPSYWCLGSRYGASPSWLGYIDDFVYTDGAGGHVVDYTPPSSPHVPDEHTLLYIPFNRPGGLIPGAEPLDDVIESLLVRAGYEQAEYSVSGSLGSLLVHGYASGNVTSTRAHLETLRPFGLYECNCSDKLYVFPRATTPAGSIPWEDLGASETPGEPSDPFPINVGNEVEVPAQIAVRYRNVSADWNTGTEFSDRINSSLVSAQTVDMPFGMTPEQAKKVADTMLKDAMAGLGRATLRLGGRKHAKYEPGDVLTTTAPDGTGYRFRIITKRDHIFMLEWDVALDDASALESEAITYEGYVPTTDPIRVAPTEWEVMALPPLQDSDASVTGPYVAITPAKTADNDEWPGAVFVRARLPEAFDQVFISGDVCVMGACLTTLGDFSEGSTVLDWTQILRVRVRGDLSSSNWDDFFADRTINAALVGDEPIRFMNADFVSTDGQFRIYDLSGLMRGQLGLEHEIDGHVASERFVLLNPSIRRMVNQTTDIGQENQVKAVTLNLLLDSVTAEDFTDDGIALRPYSPIHFLAMADTSGDIDLTWVRRSRLVARYTDQGVFAPLGEVTEAYRVKVYDGVTLVRTQDVTAQAWTYAAADIASDGFSPAAPITITVQQLSETVGEGFAATVETTAP